MAVDDRTRLNLHRKLESTIGREEADTLMAHLPPVTWNEVATKDDLSNEMQTMGSQLRAEMQTLNTELRSEMHTLNTELRSEMHTMHTELRTEMHTMHTELRSEMNVGFATLRTDFVEGTNRQLKWMVTFAAAWTSLLVTLVRFMP